MAETGDKPRRRGARKLSELVGQAIDPVIARRGFATAELIAAWEDIVGRRHAGATAPEKIVWPRRPGDDTGQGILVIRVDGPKAVLIQHELGQIVERVNSFFGYAAIASARIVQGPVTARKVAKPKAATPLDAGREAALSQALSGVEGDTLRAALERLGRGVLTRPLKDS
jgi:hypothetical protein